MRLLIKTKNKKFATEFIPKTLESYIINQYRMARADKINKYLVTMGITASARTILLYAVNTLKAIKEEDYYILEVDKNRKFQGSDLNIDTLVRLITYGTADIRGYDILSKAFNYVTKKTTTLKKLYVAKQLRERSKDGSKLDR